MSVFLLFMLMNFCVVSKHVFDPICLNGAAAVLRSSQCGRVLVPFAMLRQIVLIRRLIFSSFFCHGAVSSSSGIFWIQATKQNARLRPRCEYATGVVFNCFFVVAAAFKIKRLHFSELQHACVMWNVKRLTVRHQHASPWTQCHLFTDRVVLWYRLSVCRTLGTRRWWTDGRTDRQTDGWSD